MIVKNEKVNIIQLIAATILILVIALQLLSFLFFGYYPIILYPKKIVLQTLFNGISDS